MVGGTVGDSVGAGVGPVAPRTVTPAGAIVSLRDPIRGVRYQSLYMSSQLASMTPYSNRTTSWFPVACSIRRWANLWTTLTLATSGTQPDKAASVATVAASIESSRN